MLKSHHCLKLLKPLLPVFQVELKPEEIVILPMNDVILSHNGNLVKLLY